VSSFHLLGWVARISGKYNMRKIAREKV